MVVRVALKQCFFSQALFEDVCGWQGQSHKDQGCLAAGRDHFDKDHHGVSSLWVPVGAGVFPLLSSQTLLDLARRRATVGRQGEEPVGRRSYRATAAISYHFPRVKKKRKVTSSGFKRHLYLLMGHCRLLGLPAAPGEVIQLETCSGLSRRPLNTVPHGVE